MADKKTIVLERKAAKDQAMIDVFELDGVTYQIPAEPRANISLRYMKSVRVHGQEVASAEILELLLGEDAYDALMNYEGLTTEQFEEIMTVVQEALVGKSSSPKG